MKRGMTLVELLVVMALTLILGAGILTLYRTLVGRTAEQSTIMKTEAQLNFVIDNLARLLSTAGFGIDKNQLQIGTVINLQSNQLTVLTRASTQNIQTGCWGIIDATGEFKLQVGNEPATMSITGKNCSADVADYPIRISITDKSLIQNCTRNCLAFIKNYQNQNQPEVVRLYFDNQNTQPYCLQGTGRLILDMNGAGEIISCVGHLRFRYLVRNQNGEIVSQDTAPNYDDLVGVRLCMMVQLSESAPASGVVSEPTYSERCGGGSLRQLNPNFSNNNNFMLRKWATVEMDILMPNLAK